MSDLREDLSATADSVVQDAEELIAIERQKEAAAGTPRAAALGEEARRLTESMSRKVRAEAEIEDRIERRGD